MIVSSTPLRMSFFGGGSDIKDYYKNNGGIVLSAAIDRRINIAAHFCDLEHIRVIYSKMEVVKNIEELEHNRVRELLKLFDIRSNFEMCSFSDISTRGTGLGSSSTFTVGLLSALSALKGRIMMPKEIAEMACEIEIVKCAEPIGKQDQYAAAYGGFNIYKFHKDNTVEIIPVNTIVPSYIIKRLNDNLMCFSTNKFRNASNILKDQVNNLKNGSNITGTDKLVEMTHSAIDCLKKNNLDTFGELLHEGWTVKKSLAAGISNESIDEMYEMGIKSGAIGGKLLGAGGGGYLLFYVRQDKKDSVKAAMESHGCRELKFNFTDMGTTAQCL